MDKFCLEEEKKTFKIVGREKNQLPGIIYTPAKLGSISI